MSWLSTIGKILEMSVPTSGYPDSRKKKESNPIIDSVISGFSGHFILDKIKTPAIGGVVYSGLVSGAADHSGIYVGYGRVVHLDGSGRIECVTANVFMNRLKGSNTALAIYTSCKGGKPIGSRKAAAYAKAQIGRKVKYNLLNNNCHKFTLECLSQTPSTFSCLFIEDLKQRSKSFINHDTWRVWDMKYKY
ncbi:lecithin retinol acyltransferase family protein [Pseudomonas monachiensis]|uniref:Lecithin retinol acyltransferase family protein n=1 Tax=Pseudomonas monachiensis TaxID=3060212 RepID=A0ABW9HBF4_9PSED